MTVAQLITELQKMPQDLDVYRDDYEYGPELCDRPEAMMVETREVHWVSGVRNDVCGFRIPQLGEKPTAVVL